MLVAEVEGLLLGCWKKKARSQPPLSAAFYPSKIGRTAMVKFCHRIISAFHPVTINLYNHAKNTPRNQ